MEFLLLRKPRTPLSQGQVRTCRPQHSTQFNPVLFAGKFPRQLGYSRRSISRVQACQLSHRMSAAIAKFGPRKNPVREQSLALLKEPSIRGAMQNITQQVLLDSQNAYEFRSDFGIPTLSNDEIRNFVNGSPPPENGMTESLDGTSVDKFIATASTQSFHPSISSPNSTVVSNGYASSACYSPQLSPDASVSSSSLGLASLATSTSDYHLGQASIATLESPARGSDAPTRSMSLNNYHTQSGHPHVAVPYPSAYGQAFPQIDQVLQQPPRRVVTWPVANSNPGIPELKVPQEEVQSPSDDVYYCDFPGCVKTFVKGNGTVNLDRHKDSVHGEPIPCGFCPKVYRRSDARLIHWRNHHEGLYPQGGRR